MKKSGQYQSIASKTTYIIAFLIGFSNFSFGQQFASERDSLCKITQFINEKIKHRSGWEMKSVDRNFKKLPDESFFVESVGKDILCETYLIGNRKIYIGREKKYFFIKYKKMMKHIEFNTDVKLVFLGYLKREKGLMEFKFKAVLPNCVTAISLDNWDKKSPLFYSVFQYDFFPR